MTHLGAMYRNKFRTDMTGLIGKFMTEYRSNDMAPSLVIVNAGSPITYMDNVRLFFSASL